MFAFVFICVKAFSLFWEFKKISCVQILLLDRTYVWYVVMGGIPFYRTSNELKPHFSNIEQTVMCSFISDPTRTPIFWLWISRHRTSYITFIRFTKLLIEQTSTLVVQTLNGLEHVHPLVIGLEYPMSLFQKM